MVGIRNLINPYRFGCTLRLTFTTLFYTHLLQGVQKVWKPAVIIILFNFYCWSRFPYFSNILYVKSSINKGLYVTSLPSHTDKKQIISEKQINIVPSKIVNKDRRYIELKLNEIFFCGGLTENKKISSISCDLLRYT